jgi:hypothetical protein
MVVNEFSGSLMVGGIDTLDDDDGDLDSFMTGLSMSRTALRRNVGVASVERVDEVMAMGENNVPSPARTPGRWSGAGAGTFIKESEYVFGQAGTVTSGEDHETKMPRLNKIPSSVSIRSSSRSSSSKKYKLYEVPRPGKGYEDTCFSLIGQGTTFCTARRCSTTHQGDIFSPLPGALFVCKSTSRAFADPKSSVMKLTPDLLVSWSNDACSLEEWSRLFMLVKTPSTTTENRDCNTTAYQTNGRQTRSACTSLRGASPKSQRLARVLVTQNPVDAEETEKRKKINRRMAPRVSERSWLSEDAASSKLVSEDERAYEEETKTMIRPASKRKQKSRQGQKLRSRDQQKQSVPQVGDQCVILIGSTRQDVGQQGQVTELMPVMMGVKYREGHGTNRMVVKSKRPSSVLMLEEGLAIVRDRKGTLWVRRSDTVEE